MNKNIIYGFVALSIVCSLLSFDLPKGWFKAGSAPDKYDMGVDPGKGRNGGNAATIQSNVRKTRGFGTLMQGCDPDKYLGKRVRMSGYMKSIDVDGWAGFWFRVDGPNKNESLSFDNMYNRRVTGTTEWKKYEIVLNVPKEATRLAYGALLDGPGQIWFENLEFEIVPDGTPQTSSYKLPEPQNLDFNQK